MDDNDVLMYATMISQIKAKKADAELKKDMIEAVEDCKSLVVSLICDT